MASGRNPTERALSRSYRDTHHRQLAAGSSCGACPPAPARAEHRECRLLGWPLSCRGGFLPMPSVQMMPRGWGLAPECACPSRVPWTSEHVAVLTRLCSHATSVTAPTAQGNSCPSECASCPGRPSGHGSRLLARCVVCPGAGCYVWKSLERQDWFQDVETVNLNCGKAQNYKHKLEIIRKNEQSAKR